MKGEEVADIFRDVSRREKQLMDGDAYMSMEVPNMLNVDNAETALSSQPVIGSHIQDRMMQLEQEQGLIENSLDVVGVGGTMRIGSKLGRFEREASAMARKQLGGDFVKRKGRRLRSEAQNKLSDFTSGVIPKFDSTKVPLDIIHGKRVPFDPSLNAGATYNSSLRQIKILKDETGKKWKDKSKYERASDNVLQRVNIAHEQKGHDVDMMAGVLESKKVNRINMDNKKAEALGYDVDSRMIMKQNMLLRESEYGGGYKAGLDEAYKILDEAKKSGDSYMEKAARNVINWHADNYAGVAGKLPPGRLKDVATKKADAIQELIDNMGQTPEAARYISNLSF